MRPTASDLRLLSLDADGKQTAALPTVPDASKAVGELEACLERGAAQQLVDFDAHLDDAQSDWFNTRLLK